MNTTAEHLPEGAVALAQPPFEKRAGLGITQIGGIWCYAEDHRGPAWRKSDGSFDPVRELGPFPDTHTDKPAPRDHPLWNEAEDRWTVDVDAMCRSRLAAINAEYEQRVAIVRAGVPADEVASWGKQEAEARQLLADSDSVVPFLRELAAARGVPLAELALRVVAKADLAAAFTAHLIGTRQALEDRLEQVDAAAADAAEQIERVVWPEA